MSNMSNGSFYIRDLVSGKLYYVECIGKPRTEYGASLDDFCNGSIREKDSIIKPENGFTNIGYSGNPLDYIATLERTA